MANSNSEQLRSSIASYDRARLNLRDAITNTLGPTKLTPVLQKFKGPLEGIDSFPTTQQMGSTEETLSSN